MAFTLRPMMSCRRTTVGQVLFQLVLALAITGSTQAQSPPSSTPAPNSNAPVANQLLKLPPTTTPPKITLVPTQNLTDSEESKPERLPVIGNPPGSLATKTPSQEELPPVFVSRPAPPLITSDTQAEIPEAFVPGQSGTQDGPVDKHRPTTTTTIPAVSQASGVRASAYGDELSGEFDGANDFAAPGADGDSFIDLKPPMNDDASMFDDDREYESDYFKDSPQPADEDSSIYGAPSSPSMSPGVTDPYSSSEMHLTPANGRLPADSFRNMSDPVPPSDAKGAWWDQHITQPLRHSSEPRPITLSSLISAALQYSSRVRVISESPLIQDTSIIEADAAFDWTAFVETQWQDIDEPVGSTLTTGGPPRFQDEIATFEIGANRRNLRGGDFSISQQYGYEDSNSVFFIPQPQGTSRMTLNYTQPLLRNGGKVFNTSQIVLAQIQSGAARDVFSRELQDHLLDVTESYWNLFLERGLLLQRQRLYKRGQLILKDLEVREQLDAVANQIVRARAAVASRRSDLFRAAAGVKNAEGRLRALVNAPGLGIVDEFELTPMDFPATYAIPLELHETLQAAFRNRPEIREALKQVRAGAVRLNVSQNELLPILDLTLDSYVNGLRGDSNIGGAWVDQFGDGAPSYTAGLRFEMPLGNRAARARFQRRAIELRQLEHQFRNTLQVLQLDVEITVRETHTAFREIEAKRQALRAAESEVDFLTQRWELMPGEDRSTSLLLEDLLAAQERLAQQEFEFLNAQIQYNISIVNLKKATGTLLQFEQVNVGKSEIQGIPELHLSKQDAMVMPAQAYAPANGPHMTANGIPTVIENSQMIGNYQGNAVPPQGMPMATQGNFQPQMQSFSPAQAGPTGGAAPPLDLTPTNF